MQNKPLVSIIILTHNRKKAYQMCFDSVYSQDYPRKEIIVVDNGSLGGMVSFLKNQAQAGKIKLILNKENKGACIGRNQGFRESKGEYILFLDSDVVLVDERTVSKAVEEMNKNEKLGELGGIGFLDKNLSKVQHGILKIEKDFEINSSYLTQIPEEINFEADYIQTDFALFRRRVFEKTGGFDPFYFYYPEDTDLSFCVKRKGFQIAVSPRIKFWHQYLFRRADISHYYFYKKVYLFFKNFSLRKGLEFYFFFLKNGIKRIISTSNKTRSYFLILWYLATPFSLFWLILFFPLIRLRRRINFLSGKQSLFSKISEKILYFPIRLEEKLLEILGRMLFWLKTKRGKIGLYLFVTNRCNYACMHCFLGTNPAFKKQNIKLAEKELTPFEIEKTYNSLRKKIGGISITGGEPFLRKDIVEICKIFQRSPFVSSIHLNTNGFNPEIIKRATKRILENAPEKQKVVVTISLDGLEQTHDTIRGIDGAFRNAVKTILALKDLENTYSNFRLRAQFTLMKINYEDFFELFDFVTNKLKVDFSFNWFREGRAYGIAQDLIWKPMFTKNSKYIGLPSGEKCEEIYEFLLENRWYDLNLNLINRYTLQILKNKKCPFSCVTPKLNLVLYADGGVSFCELIKPIHNVRDFDYDLRKIRQTRKWNKTVLAVKNCCCIHPCALGLNIGKGHFLDIKLEGLRSSIRQ